MVWTYSRSCYIQWRYLIKDWVIILYIYIYSWYIGLTLSSILHVITCMIQKNTPYMMVVVEQKYVYIYIYATYVKEFNTHTHKKNAILVESCFVPLASHQNHYHHAKHGLMYAVCILKLRCIQTTWRVVPHGSTGKRSFHVFPTVGLESSGFPNI